MDPAIITCALNGGARGDNRHQPLSFQAIVEDGARAFDSGASILHLHAWTSEGEVTSDADVYARLADALRDRCPGVILNYSTYGAAGMSEDERLEVLTAQPELASVNFGSLNFGDGVLTNTAGFIERLLSALDARAIGAELECFDVGMVAEAASRLQQGSISGPTLIQFCLGYPFAAPATVGLVEVMRAFVPAGVPWAAYAEGSAHMAVMAGALALGGHIRTGLEDVTALPMVDEPSNAQLVESAVNLTRSVGRAVATPADARALLGLPR